ncbi:hypothetical protein ROHU_014494 [Labeo rohita]|uniref:Uncharacterized protein n=1 Tax=Labeo rohita TaxID=84645 RepID=A0A498NTA2_LABRO|nr:hypothetical protein ROHU_014494 [Labeo rohita]
MMHDGVEENRVNMSPGCSTTRTAILPRETDGGYDEENHGVERREIKGFLTTGISLDHTENKINLAVSLLLHVPDFIYT